ncbi:MAG: succinyldiaminopimelate transaminase [Burkholderiales bacterium]|nr:succinyldiaminopimelate transaminase [Burkholderiales bacterium]
MNPELKLTKPYPFTRLRALLKGAKLPEGKPHISLSLGEPRHALPTDIATCIKENLKLLEKYPPTQGTPELREAISNWLLRRTGAKVDPDTQILPTNGSREALFSFPQVIIDRADSPYVVMPDPFYQIYEGATILAGAKPWFAPCAAENDFKMDITKVPEEVLKNTALVIVCSPNNPTGKVLNLEDWKVLFEMSEKYGFVIGSDECYSEIYFDESKPPLTSMEAARKLGKENFKNLIIFSSLSKRSNAPGMRSGFVAGDADLIKPYLLYRTYHGSAMSGVFQKASIVAWNDEKHVKENRRLYREKFEAALPLIQESLKVEMPDAAFYLWAKTPIDDQEYTRQLYEKEGVTVLPGSFLAREDAQGKNPGTGYVRIALVATVPEVKEAAQRIADFKI